MLVLELDRHSGVPVYRQVVDQVRLMVASGALKEGAELSSTRAISRDYGINPMTASRAFAELERGGVIVRRPGQPHVVAPRSARARARDEAGLPVELLAPAAVSLLRLGVSEADAVAALRKLMSGAGRSVPKKSEVKKS